MSIYNGDVNGDYCYINSSTGSIIRNHNSIDYAKKREEISIKTYLRENNGFPDGVDIDYMLPVSKPIQYVSI